MYAVRVYTTTESAVSYLNMHAQIALAIHRRLDVCFVSLCTRQCNQGNDNDSEIIYY